MSAAPSHVPGGTLVDRAICHVRDFIRMRDMKVGDPVPGEGHFAAELGVSRAVMREAFGALAALRVLDVGNGRRARVSAIDGVVIATSLDHAVSTAQVSMTEIWDVRRTLERRTAELAARHRTREAADQIVAEAASMAAASGDLDLIARHDIRFHQAIAAASGNAFFYQIVRSFEPLMLVAVPGAWRTRVTAAERQEVLDCHRDLAAAVAASDPTSAQEALDRHFISSVGALL